MEEQIQFERRVASVSAGIEQSCGSALSLDIPQIGQDLSGSWEKTSIGPFCVDRGNLTGEIDGSDVSLRLTSSTYGGCVITIEARRRGEDRLAGGYHTSRCSSHGSVEIVR